jgi:hypothetical protein
MTVKLIAADNVNAIPTVDAADVAAVVRRQLKRQFPGVRFSVRTRRASMCVAVVIGWTDGPASDLIRAQFDWVEDATFDGMTDCRRRRGPVNIADINDPQTRAELLELTGGVSLMRTSSHWLDTSREYSPQAWDRIIEEIRRQHGVVLDRDEYGIPLNRTGNRLLGLGATLQSGPKVLGGQDATFREVAWAWLASTDLNEAGA